MNISKNHRNGLVTGTCVLVFLLTIFTTGRAYCQAEVEPWGNIAGIREHGQLMAFETSVRIIDGKKTDATAKEKQRPHYERNENIQLITTELYGLPLKISVKDESRKKITVSIGLYAPGGSKFDGAYFCIALPHNEYQGGEYKLSDAGAAAYFMPMTMAFKGTAGGAEFKSAWRDLKIDFDGTAPIIVKKDTTTGDDELWIALARGGISKGDSIKKTFTIKVTGNMDRTPVNLAINTNQPGRPFDGLGGNFRLQNPKFDPEVIDYCLKNLRVAFGRVELPWRLWQPEKDIDPIASADSGKLNPSVQHAMEMAHRLDSLGIPFILSAWFPPDWAIVGKPNFKPVNGVWGNPLNKDVMPEIYKSIADYVIYLKRTTGAEPRYFSFNESDLGINIRVTPQEHDDFIKGCGAYFAAHGIGTKMLLGDNSDATTYKFIYPAMNDPEARPYIGAVSFHSWRGFDRATLQHWADATTKLKVPLLVAEGSIDAAAYSYPDIFQEQSYALNEITLYVRLLAICQPESILQWQLTSDYSPLIGGGIFGNNEPLHPGQRFWNLKQLSISPKDLYAMPMSCDRPDISCAGLGDNSKASYAIHIVNNGAKRKATITGLPAMVKALKLYTTNQNENMQAGTVKVKNGQACFKMAAASYITLISE